MIDLLRESANAHYHVIVSHEVNPEYCALVEARGIKTFVVGVEIADQFKSELEDAEIPFTLIHDCRGPNDHNKQEKGCESH